MKMAGIGTALLFLTLGLVLFPDHRSTAQVIVQNEHEAAKYLARFNQLRGLIKDVPENVSDILNENNRLLKSYVLDSLGLTDSQVHGILTRLYELKDDVYNNQNISRACISDTIRIVEDLFFHGSYYAIQMLDAFAKIPNGILDGNFQWIGSYDQCKSAIAYDNSTGEPVQRFKGQYCTVFIYLPIKSLPPNTQMSVGTCLPNSCDNSTVAKLLQDALAPLIPVTGIKVTYASCATKLESFTTRDIIVMIICSLLIFASVLGTLFDAARRMWPKEEENIDSGDGDLETTNDNANLVENDMLSDNPTVTHIALPTPISTPTKGPTKIGVLCGVLLSFSWITNGSKLLNTHVRTGTLTSVNGMRVLSMWWVILGHSYAFLLGLCGNIGRAYQEVLPRFSFQALMNATVSVDSFFFLSGFLVTYLTLKELRRKDRINWAMFYFHRFWRLTPAYMLLLMFYCTLYLRIPEGPFMRGMDNQMDMVSCYTTWWANLLYINNFYPGDLAKQCMAWSWYLANDMQFFVLSPIFLYLLHRWWKIGVGAVITALLFTLTFTGAMARYHHLSALTYLSDMSNPESYASYIYLRPYHRIAPYLVGILLGFIMIATNGRVKMPKWLSALGWACAVTVGMLTVYGLYEPFHDQKDISLNLSAFYISCSRFGWSLALAWVIFACVTGYGGPVDTFLSWNVWAPIGRLTYCAYLVHPMILAAYNASMRTLYIYTDISMTYLFVGNMVFSYLAAFVLSMLIEAPMMSLEKIIFRRDEAR